jgi:hypothetical protein
MWRNSRRSALTWSRVPCLASEQCVSRLGTYGSFDTGGASHIPGAMLLKPSNWSPFVTLQRTQTYSGRNTSIVLRPWRGPQSWPFQLKHMLHGWPIKYAITTGGLATVRRRILYASNIWEAQCKAAHRVAWLQLRTPLARRYLQLPHRFGHLMRKPISSMVHFTQSLISLEPRMSFFLFRS